MKEDPPSILQTQRFWDAFYINDRVAEFRRRLYVEAYGEESPAELGTDGYITLSELRQMADALHVGPGAKIADMGCGRGGPGQWIAPPERPSWVSTFPEGGGKAVPRGLGRPAAKTRTDQEEAL